MIPHVTGIVLGNVDQHVPRADAMLSFFYKRMFFSFCLDTIEEDDTIKDIIFIEDAEIAADFATTFARQSDIRSVVIVKRHIDSHNWREQYDCAIATNFHVGIHPSLYHAVVFRDPKLAVLFKLTFG